MENKVASDFWKFTDIMYLNVVKTENCVQIHIDKMLDCDNLFKIQHFIRNKFSEFENDSYLEPKIYAVNNLIIIEFPLSLIKKLYHV